jgi:hypothetical protein
MSKLHRSSINSVPDVATRASKAIGRRSKWIENNNNEKFEEREKTNKMQQLDVYY